MSTDNPMRAAETTMTTAAGTDASFGPLKQVDAGLLSVGYAEAGPADSPAVILLHGVHAQTHRGWCRAQPAPGSPQAFAEVVVEVDGYGSSRP
jgi:pimeloyl-ACP methyl ester carboxylesterase